jgi:hypothetical protein
LISSFFSAGGFDRLGRSTWRRGDEPSVLSWYPNLSEARFDYVVDLQRQLATLDLAPEIADVDRDRRALVSNFVFGAGTRDPKIVGRRLGELHRALRVITPIGEPRLIEAPDAPERTLRDLLAKSTDPSQTAALEYKVRRVETMAPCPPLATHLIHGDIHPGNLIGERRLFIDFDLSGNFSQLYELIRGLMLYAFDATSNTLDEVWADSFLRAYHDVVSTEEAVDHGVQAYVWMLATSPYGLDGQYLDFGLWRLSLLKWLDGEGQARVEQLLREIVRV